MKIKTLRQYFKTEAEPKFFLTNVFSWRGDYSTAAFSTSRNGSKEQSIRMLNKAVHGKFEGYKGGVYKFNGETEVHFETDGGVYTDISAEDYLKTRYNVDFKC